MKFKEQKELVSDLRELADFFERPEAIVLPKIDLRFYHSLNMWSWDKVTKKYEPDYKKSLARIKAIARTIGKCEKNWTSDNFEVIKQIGKNVKLEWIVNREVVCKKVFTGNKIIHPAHIYTTPERVEEEYTWECEEVSLLS